MPSVPIRTDDGYVLPIFSDKKRGAVDCMAAQAVAALLASGNGQYRKAALAEQRKFSALLKILRAGLT
jgi:hypothetical protein